HMWWVGAFLFTPSILMWAVAYAIEIRQHGFYFPVSWYSFTYIYLPSFAALIGFSVPLVCLLLLRRASRRVNVLLFTAYLAAMLIWGVIDVRYEHYQMSYKEKIGHTSLDDNWQHVHGYFTWWFLPYSWIESPQENKRALDSWWQARNIFGHPGFES
ncbi:MAG TPA: hypothetical protein VIH42_12180, partial [Thermoguttaceae bacterium]